MKYKVNNIDDNRFELKISLSKDDYFKEVDDLLKKKRKESSFKGFRKGKTPMSFIKRTFGNAVLSDVINKKIDSGLSEYLKDNKIELMLSPMASENQEPLDIDINNLQDFEVSFDLHKKPEFEIKGISKEDEYTLYDVEVDQKVIDDQVKNFSNQFGKFETYEGEITEEHYFTVFAKELDGEDLKKDGYETEFTIKLEELVEEYKDQFLNLKVGDKVTFDVYKLIKDADESKVKDYLLNIDEKDFEEGEDLGIGNSFEGEIIMIEEFVPAELNEEFFKSQDIPEVTNEDDYRELITKDIKKHYQSESDKLLQLDIAEKLKEINEISFSQEYLDRWIHEQYPDKKDEEIDALMEDSLKDLKWQAIVDKLMKKYNVDVTKEDLAAKMEVQARRMIGDNPQMISQILEIMMKDEKLVNNTYNELFIDKIFSAAANDITKKTDNISWDDFIKIVEKYNKKNAPANVDTEEEE